VYRILVVDDESSVCDALAMGLTSREFAVDVAADGESGVRLGCAGIYDVLIADLCLPDMDGIEVIRRIRAHRPEVIPIAITAHSTRESFIDAKENGVSDYFEKPFHMHSIKTAITRGLIERSRKC
jgi:two-component system, OmpR family, response regulator